MQNINELAIEIREVAKANGWNSVRRPDWSGSDDMVPCRLALIHSEIVEAHSEFVNADTVDWDDLAAELADIQIRILDLAGGFTEDFAQFVATIEGTFIRRDVERAFNALHKITTAALEHFREDRLFDFLCTLALLSLSVDCLATHSFNIDLDDAVPAKIDVNRHRSHRHGGKRI